MMDEYDEAIEKLSKYKVFEKFELSYDGLVSVKFNCEVVNFSEDELFLLLFVYSKDEMLASEIMAFSVMRKAQIPFEEIGVKEYLVLAGASLLVLESMYEMVKDIYSEIDNKVRELKEEKRKSLEKCDKKEAGEE